MSDPTNDNTDREVVNLHATDLPEIGNDLRLLPVPLTPDEWAVRATASAMLGGEIQALTAELKVHTNQVRAEIRDLQGERERVDRAVRDNAEERPVGIRVLAELDDGVALVVRVDTGQVLERRPLTEEEAARASQRILDFPG